MQRVNDRQVKAYNQLMDYVENEDKIYRNLMRNEKNNFALFPKFENIHRNKILKFEKLINAKTKEVVEANRLSHDEVSQLEGVFKRSSLHVERSSLQDLYLPSLIALFGMVFLMTLFSVLANQGCSIELTNEGFQDCIKGNLFRFQFFNYTLGIIISAFILLAVKRRSTLLVIANRKSLISEYLRKIAESISKN